MRNIPVSQLETDQSAEVEIKDLTRTFVRADGTSVTAVAGVSLRIDVGEFVCVVGPSGHGKTTLLQMVAGLLDPTSGEVRVGGIPVVEPGPERGVVFQRDSVFPWMRVIDNVEYGLRCRGVAKDTRRQIARQYLDAVGLEGLERSWPRELSGGMLKRVAVATVFANGAKVLLLDEPFGTLDYVTKRQVQRVLLRLWEEAETGSGSRRTVLFVTHDIDEALTLADRIIVIRGGRIVEDLRIELPRPRTDDDLALPRALNLKHTLLTHIGLELTDDDVEHQRLGGGA